ncbi:MAG: stage 0 sporulation protein [Nitrospiraceae bacterium]|nr:stage 0 sporulation protein [Nitrospiraceae bacterium]
MPDVIGIKFKQGGKVYDFEVDDSIEFIKGEYAIVESELGLSIGKVVTERHIIGSHGKELKKILRKATEEDFKHKQDNESFEKEARTYCLERIEARELPMKLISIESTLDKKRLVFYFTADGRIDFREIVKDLAAKFKTRIEMRQIGVRDEAKIVGGFGMCGRELCCKTFLVSFEPISIKMAKQQELVLNMSKLSGICGRLMCCLGYECAEDRNGSPVIEDTSVITGDAISIDVNQHSNTDLNGETKTYKDQSAVSKNPDAAKDNQADKNNKKFKKWPWKKHKK